MCEAGEQVAAQVGREAEQRPDEKPKVNVNGIEEVVADKGYHSGAVVQRIKSYEVRTYIPEKQQKGRTPLPGQDRGTISGLSESTAGAGRVRQELTQTTR